MSTRAIRTSTPQTACDVCGRTLLRGERSEIYLSGGDRHSVCELCTSRALHGGWVREGTVPDYGPSRERVERRRSLLGLRRGRRRPEAGPEPEEFTPPPEFMRDLEPDGLEAESDPAPPPAFADELTSVADPDATADEMQAAPSPDWPQPPPRTSRRARRGRSLGSRPRAQDSAGDREPAGGREPRHVHAVPTSVAHKTQATIELFNASEHPRTVAGIARSLGLPDVAVHPSSPVGAVVNVVVAWELCWYRYEVDLSEEVPVVRGAGKGYELDDLTPGERQRNAVADDDGRLATVG